MNGITSSHGMHAVTAKEAKRIAKVEARRAEALRLFKARYRHRPESQRAMVGGLRRLATRFSDGLLDEKTFPWEVLIRRHQTQRMWDSVAAHYSRRTALKDASTLRVMLGYCRDVGLLTNEQCREAKDFDTKHGGEHRPPAGRYLSDGDINSLAHTCGGGNGGANTRIRDVALLCVLGSGGMRGDELSQVHLSEVNLQETRIFLSHVKGTEARYAYLHPAAVEALQLWLGIRGYRPGPLFVPLSRTGRPLHERGRLSTFQIRKIVRRRAEEAGVGHVTPHDLRRFVISQLLTEHDLVLVANIVGHKNPATTAIYDRRPAEQQAAAVATLPLPSLTELLSDRSLSQPG